MKMSFEQSIPDLFLKKWFCLCRRGFGEEARTVSSAAVHYQGQPGRSLPRPARTLTGTHSRKRDTQEVFSRELESLGSVGSEKGDDSDSTVSAFTWLVEKKGRGLGFKKMFCFRGVE